MVHFGGRRWRRAEVVARPPGRLRTWTLVAGLAVSCLAVPRPASAQAAIGFQGGFAIDPEQVYGGVFFQTNDLGGGFRLRPGIDGATGQGFRIATIDFDLVYGYPLGSGIWTFLVGGGPAVVVTRFANFGNVRDTGLGLHTVVNLTHDNGFFVEGRLGSYNAQRFKLGVGWAIRLD